MPWLMLLYQHNKHSIKSNDPSPTHVLTTSQFVQVNKLFSLILMYVITIHNNAQAAGNATILILQMLQDQLDLSSSWVSSRLAKILPSLEFSHFLIDWMVLLLLRPFGLT